MRTDRKLREERKARVRYLTGAGQFTSQAANAGGWSSPLDALTVLYERIKKLGTQYQMHDSYSVERKPDSPIYWIVIRGGLA